MKTVVGAYNQVVGDTQRKPGMSTKYDEAKAAVLARSKDPHLDTCVQCEPYVENLVNAELENRAEPRCRCDGGTFEVKRNPFLIHQERPIHANIGCGGNGSCSIGIRDVNCPHCGGGSS